MTDAAPRRTQEERRATTIAKVVEATIESIEQVGYHRTSLGEICGRSGVSRGGLFRHFDSRLDVIVAAADAVAYRHIAAFDDLQVDGASVGIEGILKFTRDRVRHETNAVWFEVCVAARTDPDLRDRVAPIMKWLYDSIEERARSIFESIGAPPDVISLVVTSLVHMFDGEAIIAYIYARPDLEKARIDAAAEIWGTLTTDFASRTGRR